MKFKIHHGDAREVVPGLGTFPLVEIWRPVPGWEGLYEISNHGRLKTLQRRFLRHGITRYWPEKIKKFSSCKKGYRISRLTHNERGQTVKLHRLVATVFIRPPLLREEVNHKDGVKSNNVVTNLEWVTAKENAQHAVRTGLRVAAKGESHGRAKLREVDIPVIRALLATGEGVTIIAKKFNVSTGPIAGIKQGKLWTHV